MDSWLDRFGFSRLGKGKGRVRVCWEEEIYRVCLDGQDRIVEIH